jgi:thiol-disulfide isomerase/thioredoxin
MNRSAAVPLLALALLATPSLAAEAPGIDAFLSEFKLSGDYVVEIAGKDSPKGEVYFSERARSYLVRAEELPSPVLVSPAAREVQSLDAAKLASRKDGTVDVLADAVLRPEGGFHIENEIIAFEAGGKPVRLEPRPWLLGAKSGADMTGYNPEYRRRAAEYTPDAKIVERLKARGEPVRVLTIFGSWCPHCKKHVPMLMKVAEQLAGTGWQFDYYGVPSPFTGDPTAEKYKIRGVPTAIVFVGGREIGRLPAASWAKPEAGLESVLAGTAAAGSR